MRLMPELGLDGVEADLLRVLVVAMCRVQGIVPMRDLHAPKLLKGRTRNKGSSRFRVGDFVRFRL